LGFDIFVNIYDVFKLLSLVLISNELNFWSQNSSSRLMTSCVYSVGQQDLLLWWPAVCIL